MTTLNPRSIAHMQQVLLQNCDVYPSVFDAREHLLEVTKILSNLTQEEFDILTGVNDE